MTSTALALETRPFAPTPLHRRSRRVRVRQVMAARGASSQSHDNGSHDPGSWTPPARTKKSVSTNADSLAAGKKNINLGSGGLAPPRAVAIGRPSDQQDQLPSEPANADSRSALRDAASFPAAPDASSAARRVEVSDGCDAAAHVAHKLAEVVAIYPITPSTPMGEAADLWSSKGRPNLWGSVPRVVELQSEAGAAGTVHGALQAGALATTFTASQGLLLMIPEMYKIAGELLPFVMYVTARSLAAQGLSIFGDHSDVMAVRSTGFAMLSSSNVQEAQDLSLVAHAATLRTRVPFVHFFDGFRTSHEMQKIERLEDEDLRALVPEHLVLAHRKRALSPARPVVRGTAQNPDVYFQGRETVNPFVAAVPDTVQECMDSLAARTGRFYQLVEYVGDPCAEHVAVAMGASCGTLEAVVHHLNQHEGRKVGLLKVRLFRPFPAKQMVQALPPTVKRIVVLEKTKETGATGEPMYCDVVAALHEEWPEQDDAQEDSDAARSAPPRVMGARYGLGGKDFTPAMAKGVFEELASAKPRRHVTVGIVDDVSFTSIPYDPSFLLEPEGVRRCLFYGMGGDGTVGASKNSCKIVGEETPLHIQGYFDYDSKKAGSITTSHLRFSKEAIDAAYLIPPGTAQFVCCNFPNLVNTVDMIRMLAPGGTFLLNSPVPAEKLWDTLPAQVQEGVLEKGVTMYAINAMKVARDAGMGRRVNTVMQTCFFDLSGIMPREEALAAIRSSVVKSYTRKGQDVVEKNFKAIEMTLDNLVKVTHAERATSGSRLVERLQDFKGNPGRQVAFDPFMSRVTEPIVFHKGNSLPVSVLPEDGTYPTGTATWDKISAAQTIPVWEKDICIQCNKCVVVCPHAAIRAKPMEAVALESAPPSFQAAPAKGLGRDMQQFTHYSIQVTPDGCTGCTLCVDVCPASSKDDPALKAINMRPNEGAVTEHGREGWNFFETLAHPDRSLLKVNSVKGSQFLEPLFEFSGACLGCGETPYVKLVSQLFGDRLIVANATGCSSIYGGNLPTTPWTKNAEGRGPAWMNSLFEDNAEFGYGIRLTVDQHSLRAFAQLKTLLPHLDASRSQADDILANPPELQVDEAAIQAQRSRVQALEKELDVIAAEQSLPTEALAAAAEMRDTLTEYLVKHSVWLMGGDGWAYDIGFGGLDHVMQSGANVNVLVLDTEGYANTGGQCSKSTPRAAVAKFAQSGKPARKKDLGAIAMTYGNVYVASVAMGANDAHTVKTFLEAEAYPGPSLIIAYSHCIAHGIETPTGHQQQRAAVDSGYWPLYRYNPANALQGKNPMSIDSKRDGKTTVEEYARPQNRFGTLRKADPESYEHMMSLAQDDMEAHWDHLNALKNEHDQRQD